MKSHDPIMLNRRALLGRASQGLGSVALASLIKPSLLGAAPSVGALGQPPLPQKAKRVIWLTMAGGPSHLETFDYKPKLAEMDGLPMPESFTRGQQLAQLQGHVIPRLVLCHSLSLKLFRCYKVGSRAGSDSDAVVADQHAVRPLPGLRTACPGLPLME